MIKKCLHCKNAYDTGHKESHNRQRKYCSHKCYIEAYRGKRRKSIFVAGHTPWNKNLKGIHLSPSTEFKKGMVSNKLLPLGTITKRRGKGGTIRQFIKIAEPNKWILYAEYLWINHNGNIPKGFVIHHINKNPLDDRIENLCLLTRAAHMNIHRVELNHGKKK